MARTKATNGTASKTANGKTKGLEIEVRMCAVKLSEQELIARGDEMADCELAIEKLKGDRSELARAVKDKERRRNELGHVLESGTEPREVKCTWQPDYEKNVFRLTRPDTGEEVDTRAMTAADRNTDLFPVEHVDVGHENIGELPPPPRSPRAPTQKPKRQRSSKPTELSQPAKA